MIWRFEKFWWIFFVLALLTGCSTALIDQSPSPLGKEIILEGSLGPVTFSLEIADTPALRAKGLMGRTALPMHHGMLFIFDTEDRHVFWMKNTPLSLDLIFLNNALEVVGVIENAEPYSLSTLQIEQKSRYVLEVLADTAKKQGINLHSTARLSYE